MRLRERRRFLGNRSQTGDGGLTGGEPLGIVPEDPLIYLPVRRRPDTVLNWRLPRIAARDVFLRVPFADC